MNFFDDFRASYAPATAKRRHDHFLGLLQAAGAEDALREMRGDRNLGLDPIEREFRMLLRAQVDFARAQLQAINAREAVLPRNRSAETRATPEQRWRRPTNEELDAVADRSAASPQGDRPQAEAPQATTAADEAAA